jgi:TolB-like protein/DNA-binding winged helix-turn-helix (wHTH) protein
MESGFHVGPWLALPSRNTLSLDGKTVHLEPKVMLVLVCLAGRAGETLTKDQLLETVWPDTFVTDDVLTRCISELRRAFEDDPKEARFIQTIPKRGYRLVAPVVTVKGQTEAGVAKVSQETKPWSRAVVFGAIGLILIGGVTALWWVIPEGPRDRALGRNASPKIRSLAVLPLTNLSADQEQAFFSDGMTDALTTELSQISSIKVISRTSANLYRKTDKPMAQVARELGADGIVEGTVQRSGNRVRISAQLIYAPEDRHLWANSYERDSGNILALQQDVARAIAEEIRATLTPRERARLARRGRPLSLSALEAFLQGQYHAEQAEGLAYRRGSSSAHLEELESARTFYEQAVQEDPAYAQAYVGLAGTWRDLPVSDGGPVKAETLLRKAIELDSELAEAHEALATLDVLRLWRWTEAEQEYKIAIQLNPNSAEAHARFAEYLDCMKRFEEGMNEFFKAQELDPGHSFQPNPFYRRRQYDRAIQVDEGEVKRQAFGFWSHMDLAFDYDAAGKRAEGAREWEEVMRELGYSDLADAMHHGMQESGFQGALKALVAGLEAADARGERPPSFFPAMLYGQLGQKDRAFYWLERGYGERSAAYSALNVDPCWDPLRSDPRFNSLVRRVGLSQ